MSYRWQKREDVDSEEEFQYSVGLRWRLYVGKNQDLLIDEDECSDDEMGVRSRGGGAAQTNVEEGDGEEEEEEDPEVIFKCEVSKRPFWTIFTHLDYYHIHRDHFRSGIYLDHLDTNLENLSQVVTSLSLTIYYKSWLFSHSSLLFSHSC
jgi:hypothetical protein